MGFFSLFVPGQALTQTLPRHQTGEPNTGTYAADYLTRSVRRARGFVLVGDSETEPKSFLSGTKQPHMINGLTAEAYLCQKNVQNNIEPTFFVSGGLGVIRKRRESTVRSDGCKPPQPTARC